MTDKKQLINDLYRIAEIQGEHTGRWSNEFAREDSSEYYLEKMEMYAETYGISYDDNLEHYRYYDEDLLYELQDRLAGKLHELLKDKIIKQLLEE